MPSTKTKNSSRQLKKARQARSQAAVEMRALRLGNITLRELLENPERYEGLCRCAIYDVLRKAPKFGKDGAKKLLLHVNVWPLDQLRFLTKREREAILANLPPRVR